MDKAKLKQQVEEMKVKLAELEKEIAEKKFVDINSFTPGSEEVYWFHGSVGNMDWNQWNYTVSDTYRLAIGNVYLTKEEADNDLNRAYAEGQLRMIARRLNDVEGDACWYVCWDTTMNRWGSVEISQLRYPGDIGFTSEDISLKAINMLEERARKILEGGVKADKKTLKEMLHKGDK